MNYNYEFTLKLYDKIRLGNDIILSVNRLGTKNTDFGIEAPKHISIVRYELQEKEVLLEEVILKR